MKQQLHWTDNKLTKSPYYFNIFYFTFLF